MSEHPKKVVLLDLDGTLTKSDPGIIGCVVKAFQEMGYPVPDADELQRFIGPAISESMMIPTTQGRKCRDVSTTPSTKAFPNSLPGYVRTDIV